MTIKPLAKLLALLFIFTLLFSLTACGGGGGEGGGDTAATNPANATPVSIAGADKRVLLGDTVTLDGTASSDADNDALTYSWSFISKPPGSSTTLSSATAVNPTFTPDLSGDYVISLIVNDGTLNGTADSVTITVTHEQAVTSLTLVGGSDTIGTIQFDLILPSGYSLSTDTLGDLSTGVLTISIADSRVDTNYLPEDNLNFGQLTLALINANGFPAGSFATLAHDLVSDEALPLNADYIVSNLLVTDLNGVELAGYSVEIGIQQQTVLP